MTGYRLVVTDPAAFRGPADRDAVANALVDPRPDARPDADADPRPDARADPHRERRRHPPRRPPTRDAGLDRRRPGRRANGRVAVQGTVTAEAGRLGRRPSSPSRMRRPRSSSACRTARPRRPVGTLLRVSGKLAEPYGQLEIRPGSRDIAPLGVLPVPDPLPVVASSLGEASEGRLVAIEGRLDGPIVRDSNGDLSLALIDATGAPFRARAARGAGIGADVARAGARLRVSGVVGHAGDRKGALDG